MIPAIQRIFQSNGLSDNTRAPTAAYAVQVYEVLSATLFPHIANKQGIPDTNVLSSEVILLMQLRKVFGRLGIDLVMSDLREPDAARLCHHLDKIAAYAEFREKHTNDPESPANQCQRALAKLQDTIAEQARTGKELERIESALAKDRDEYPVLEKKRREANSRLKLKHNDCLVLVNRANEHDEAIKTKEQELERIEAEVAAIKESVAAFKPFIDEKTGVVENAKYSVEKLRVEVAQERARQRAQFESNGQLEQNLESLRGIETQLPGLEDALKEYRLQKEVLTSAEREQAVLYTESERKRRLLTSLEDTVESLETQVQQLREQEAKLRRDIDNTGSEYDRAVATIKEEEGRISDEVSALRVSTVEIKQRLNRQCEYNKQVLDLLETAPQKIATVERELDKALSDIANIKVPSLR